MSAGIYLILMEKNICFHKLLVRHYSHAIINPLYIDIYYK